MTTFTVQITTIMRNVSITCLFLKKNLVLAFTVIGFTTLNAQNVGVGTLTPTERLDVAGNIRTTGELRPNGVAGQAGQVLTSTGSGTMLWSPVATSNASGNGGWGDCNIYNIDSLRMAANANAQPLDDFGRSVSISGDFAIVGAMSDDEGGFIDNGSATIFKYNGATGQWDNQGKLINPNAQSSDQFGCSVSISGDYAIVGAFYDDEAGFTNSGSATIFKRNTSTGVWESQGKLVNANPANYDNFGFSVSISGNYAIVGSYADDEGGFTDNGSVTIYKRNTTTGVWESQGKFINASPANGDSFGNSVGISGDYAIVGAYADDEDGMTDNGSITFFKRNTTTGAWESQGKLIDMNGFNSNYFGHAVSISGDNAIVGIPRDDNGLQIENGSALIYARNTTTGVWQEQGKLYNANPETDDNFGTSVCISNDYAIVGTSRDDENGSIDNGSVTIFKRFETVWYPHQKFNNPGQTGNGTRFGFCVTIGSNNRFIVGTPYISYGRGMVFFGKAK